MGDASSVRLALLEETTFGVLAVGTYDFLRYTGEDLSLDRGVTESGEIDPTRQPAGSIPTSKSVGGGFSTELSLIAPAASPGNGYDPLIEGAMMSDWSTVVALTSQDIDIQNVSGGTFDLVDTLAGGAFTDIVKGQWIKLAGFTTNGTIYAHVTTKTDNDNVSCEGVRAAGAAVTNEAAGGTVISVNASMVRIGATNKSYSLERQYSDLATPEYTMYLGMWVGTWERTVSPEAIITERWGFRGKSQDTTTSTGTGGSETAKWTTPRLNAIDDIAWLMEGAFTAITSERVTRISHNLDNRPRIDLAISEDGPIDVGVGNPRLTGAFNTFMTDGSVLRKFEDRTFSKLAYLIDDGTRQQLVTVPNLLYTRATGPAAGNDRPVEVVGEWSAEADTDGVAFQIDRF